MCFRPVRRSVVRRACYGAQAAVSRGLLRGPGSQVTFEYEEGPCPIYEEFVFNDRGEITFIEAWSDQPEYLPMGDPEDRWAEGSGVQRLSTRIPGLGNETGLIDLDSEAMQRAAEEDPEIADFVRRAKDFWPTYLEAAQEAGPDYYARGCGWVE